MAQTALGDGNPPTTIFTPFPVATWEVATSNTCLGSWAGNVRIPMQGSEAATFLAAAANDRKAMLGGISPNVVCLTLGAATRDVAASHPCWVGEYYEVEGRGWYYEWGKGKHKHT